MAGNRFLRAATGMLTVMLLSGVLTVGASHTGDEGPAAPRAWAPKDSDWTQFRHDAAHSGVTGANATMRFAYYKWAARTGSPVTSSPAVASLRTTGNGTDVVVGSGDGRLYCINGMNGNIRWRYQTGGAIESSPAISDIDGDGIPEVIFGSDDGRIYALNGEDGTLLWRLTTRGPIYGSPALADLNNDGRPEVVVGGYDGNVYALDGAGARVWTATTPLGHDTMGIRASPAVRDINGDGVPDVVVPAGDWNVYAFKGSDGTRLWNHSISGLDQNTGIVSSPLLAYLDSDSNVDVAVAGEYGSFFCLDGRDGSEKWNWTGPGYVASSPAGMGLDYDGGLEIFVGFSTYMVCLNGNSGNIEWGRDFTSTIRSAPALADVNGDGDFEVVFGGDDRVLRALDAMTGAPVWAYPCPRAIRSSPAVADIDQDGKAEVVFGCDDGRIYALDYNF